MSKSKFSTFSVQGAKKDPKGGKAPAKAPKKKEGGGGGKAKKKKWSKGKTRDKLNNLVLFDKPTYDKLLKEVPTYKLITPSIVSERLKVRGSLARKALQELTQKGKEDVLREQECEAFSTRRFSCYRSSVSCKSNVIFFFVSGLIRQVVQHSSQLIYTRVTKDEADE